MDRTRHWPSPGDSATDFSGLERASGNDHVPDDTDDRQWSSTIWESTPSQQLVEPAADPFPARHAASVEASARRQRLLLIVLASYASAATIALLYLLVTSASGRQHDLESLPDVAPLKPDEFRYAPAHASLPPGHRMRIGESRKFGHILVEPLRVTRGVVEFVHFSGNSPQQPPDSVVGLKLWVRFTNLSEDQMIAPLDRTLLFKRDFLEEADQLFTNNFITVAGGQSADSPRLCILDVPLAGDWDLKAQQLGVRLKPGESVETFLPSQPDGIDALDGEIVWRMHIRKGYHAPTGHGVTTLLEVAFTDQQIGIEPGQPATAG